MAILIPPDDGAAPQLVERADKHPRRCPCGTMLPAGQPFIEVVGLSPTLTGIFREQAYCSLPCVRAAFLESLAELDCLATPTAEVLVTDLRDAFAHLASSFLKLPEESASREFGGARGL